MTDLILCPVCRVAMTLRVAIGGRTDCPPACPFARNQWTWAVAAFFVVADETAGVTDLDGFLCRPVACSGLTVTVQRNP